MAASAFDISFVIDAAMSGAFSGAFRGAADTMGELQKRMSALSQNQSGIASFGKLQSAATQTAAVRTNC
ncbi:hypothetical protein FACS1894167_14060 [Synergistales bacterium]|nr:hypothetical protein FACS1894167_14060 [Synergistales bacterium]